MERQKRTVEQNGLKYSSEIKPSDGKDAGLHPAPTGKVGSAQHGIEKGQQAMHSRGMWHTKVQIQSLQKNMNFSLHHL